MMASSIKQINVGRPDIQVYVDFGNIPADKKICEEVIRFADINATPMSGVPPAGRWSIAQHVSYPKRTYHHLIAEMLAHIEQQCPEIGVLPYDDSIRASYPVATAPRMSEYAGYVLMPSQGVLKTSAHKEWDGLYDLARLLRAKREIIHQVALNGDTPLKWAARQYYQLNLMQLIGLIRDSKYVVSLENGLSHLAGHMKHRCYTLYRHAYTQPWHTRYEGQVPVIDEVLSPERMVEIIEKDSVLW